MPETNPQLADDDYLAGVKKKIRLWQAEKPGVLSVLLGYAAAPVVWAFSVLIPTSAVEGALVGLDWMAKNTVSSQSSNNPNDLASCDTQADQVITIHAAGGAIEGGIAGFFGVFAIPVDIPAVVTLAMRTVRQVGVEYGYGEDSEEERLFILNVLRAAGANSQVEKAEAIAMAAYLTNILLKQTFKGMAAKAALNPIGGEAIILAVKGLARQLGLNLTKRKALAALPGIGAIVGASANGWFIREVGIAAQMLYQQRWLRDRNLLVDGEFGET